MKIPVCIISYNRALYLDSLLHSLESELDDVDVVVVDNGSTESRMRDVFDRWKKKVDIISLSGGDWINDEYKAKNAFIRHCADNYDSSNYLFLQDDLQYVGPPGLLSKVIKDLSASNFLNISLTGVRRSTIASQYSNKKVGGVWQLKDNHFGTIGIHRREVFDSVGPYEQSYPTVKSYWGRGEDDYHARVIARYGSDALISGFAHVPVFAGVWNDPRGHYSFLREGRRYGYYVPPVKPHEKYYENLTVEEYDRLSKSPGPSSFVDIAKPAGWSLTLTKDGDQMKYPQSKIIEEGPVSHVQ